jgi:hypothetical protein
MIIVLKFSWSEVPTRTMTGFQLGDCTAEDLASNFVIISVLTTPTGHAGALLGSRWFITGGGNNRAGCSDLMALELGGLGRGGTLSWRHVVDVEPRSALASEGLTLLAVPEVIDAGPFTA